MPRAYRIFTYYLMPNSKLAYGKRIASLSLPQRMVIGQVRWSFLVIDIHFGRFHLVECKSRSPVCISSGKNRLKVTHWRSQFLLNRYSKCSAQKFSPHSTTLLFSAISSFGCCNFEKYRTVKSIIHRKKVTKCLYSRLFFFQTEKVGVRVIKNSQGKDLTTG